MDYTHELTIAREAALKAGDHIRAIYESATDEEMAIDRKSDGSPLTRADVEANAIIIEELQKVFGADAYLSEEMADDAKRLSAARVWIIDPLDGTKEFLKRNGEFTVNIALAVDHQPVVGAVYVPARDEMYFAAAGQGAWSQVKRDMEPVRIHVSATSEPSDMILAASRSHAGPEIQKMIDKVGFKDVLSRGSSLKGCMVASGVADVYCRFGPTNEWDICAMNAVINEAGGILTRVDGTPLPYNQPDPLNTGFIASNNKAHETLVELGKTD